MFTSEDLGQSSSYRELKAIYYVLLSCVEQLWQKRVKVFCKNSFCWQFQSPPPVSSYEHF